MSGIRAGGGIARAGDAEGGKQVALIRGINVGRAKRVAMGDLRALIEGLGYGDVRTLLNSGNVIYTAASAAPGGSAPLIEEALATRLGVSARVTVLTAAEIAAAVADNPLLGIAHDPTRLLVAVLANPADRMRLESLAEQIGPPRSWPSALAWPTYGAPRGYARVGWPRPWPGCSATP